MINNFNFKLSSLDDNNIYFFASKKCKKCNSKGFYLIEKDKIVCDCVLNKLGKICKDQVGTFILLN